MKKNKISVIIPTHNSEDTILRAIESVICQDIDLELIVIDDCSSDRTSEILERYADDLRIKIIRLNANMGVSHARNVGIEKSNCSYLMFLDADDYLEPGVLKEMVEKAEDADIVFCGYKLVDNSSNLLSLYNLPNGFWESKDSSKVFFEYLDYGVTMMSSCAKVFKKELIKNIRFNEKITNSEDFDFIIEIFSCCFPKVKFLELVGYNYVKIVGLRKYRKNSIDDHLHTMKRLSKYAEKTSSGLLCRDKISDLMHNQIASDLVTLARKEPHMNKKISQFKMLRKDQFFMNMPISKSFPVKRALFMKTAKKNWLLGYLLAYLIR